MTLNINTRINAAREAADSCEAVLYNWPSASECQWHPFVAERLAGLFERTVDALIGIRTFERAVHRMDLAVAEYRAERFEWLVDDVDALVARRGSISGRVVA